MVQWLLDHYENRLHLEVTADNEKAVRFYKGIGLVITDQFTTKEGVDFLKFSSPT
jgi:ribosomal protein S18 acetylase RimI-like enzyme